MAITEKGRAIGARVHALRLRHGPTQAALAALAGINRTHLVNVEAGRNQASTVALRAALAQAFGLSREDMDRYLDGKLTADQAFRRRARTRTEG